MVNITVELLTLVVAWCGTPTYSRLETVKVDECRVKIVQCLHETKNIDACFVKMKMGE